MVKNLPAMQVTRVRSLGQEDPSEKGMATHSSFLAWRTPWTRELGGLQSMGLQRVWHDWATNVHTQLIYNIVLVSDFLLKLSLRKRGGSPGPTKIGLWDLPPCFGWRTVAWCQGNPEAFSLLRVRKQNSPFPPELDLGDQRVLVPPGAQKR